MVYDAAIPIRALASFSFLSLKPRSCILWIVENMSKYKNIYLANEWSNIEFTDRVKTSTAMFMQTNHRKIQMKFFIVEWQD